MKVSYQKPSCLKGKLNKYASDLNSGNNYIKFKGDPEKYVVLSKKLELVFPDVPFTTSQKKVIVDFLNTAKDTYGIDVVITILK